MSPFDYEDEPFDYEDEPREPENSIEVPVTVTIGWDDSEVMRKVVSDLSAKILRKYENEIKRRVFDGLDDLINDLLGKVVEREVTLTDQWGQPQTAPTTIRTLLQQDTEQWLTARVDRYGRTDSRRYSKDQTRAQYLFGETMDKTLTAQVKQIIIKNIGDLDELIAAEVKKQLRQKIG